MNQKSLDPPCPLVYIWMTPEELVLDTIRMKKHLEQMFKEVMNDSHDKADRK